MHKNLPKRNVVRLRHLNYSEPGAYFITICTQNRRCILSEISVGAGLAPPENRLTEYGRIAVRQIEMLESRFPSVAVDRYVVMPNHIHLLVCLRPYAGGSRPAPTVSDIIRVFKSQTTRLCKCGTKLFQRSFYDHVVRGEEDYQRIWQYIDTTPAKWAEDRFFRN